MRKLATVVGVLVGLVALIGLGATLLTPWMDRWGATDAEVTAIFPGDELLPLPASFVNRAITVQAAPEEIFSWLVQLGAERGGLYSYTWLDNSLLGCKLVDVNEIRPELQTLRVGDTVKMCPGESGPPPYLVAEIIPNEALVLGHRQGDAWADLWQFVLLPQGDRSTRLILRTRTMMTGGFWSVIHPGIFIMERGMLRGIRDRAEMTAGA